MYMLYVVSEYVICVYVCLSGMWYLVCEYVYLRKMMCLCTKGTCMKGTCMQENMHVENMNHTSFPLGVASKSPPDLTFYLHLESLRVGKTLLSLPVDIFYLSEGNTPTSPCTLGECNVWCVYVYHTSSVRVFSSRFVCLPLVLCVFDIGFRGHKWTRRPHLGMLSYFFKFAAF